MNPIAIGLTRGQSVSESDFAIAIASHRAAAGRCSGDAANVRSPRHQCNEPRLWTPVKRRSPHDDSPYPDLDPDDVTEALRYAAEGGPGARAAAVRRGLKSQIDNVLSLRVAERLNTARPRRGAHAQYDLQATADEIIFERAAAG